MSTASKTKKQCAAKTKKPGNPLCTTPAVVKFDGCDYCKQHAKLNGWVEKIPDVSPPSPKAAPKATKNAKTTAKKTEEKKTKTPKAAAEEVEEDTSGVVVKPGEGKHGTCTSHKSGKKERCGNPGKFKCPESCSHCGGQPKCGMHWNSVHKSANVSGGKAGSTRKQVSDDKKCSHNKKSGDKGPCGKVAYGVDADGHMACFTHGGPKKEDSSTSSGSSGSSSSSGSTGSGVFSGVNWPRFTSKLANFMRDFYSGDADEVTAESEAMMWTLTLVDMFKEGQPETEQLVAHFAKSAWSAHNDAEYVVTYKHTMLFVLRDVFGEVDTNWLVRMYGNLSKEPGDEAAQVATIWTAAAKECNINIAVASTSTSGSGSSTKGAAVVTSNRKATTQALIKKAQAAKAAAASDKGKEEAEEEPAKEDKTEPMDEDKDEDTVEDVKDAEGGADMEPVDLDVEDDEASFSVDSDGNMKGVAMAEGGEEEEDFVPAEEDAIDDDE